MPKGEKKMTTTMARENSTLTRLTAGLPGDQVSLVERVFRERTFSAGTTILKDGDYQDFVYLVTRGKVRVYGKPGRQQESTILVSGPGSFVGFDTLLRDNYNKNVVAIDDVTVIYSPRDTLLHLMSTIPQVALNVIGILGTHITSLEERIESFSGGALQRRLVLTLLQLAEDGQKAGDGKVHITGATHEFLASIVGASREAVTITLGKLREAGALEQGSKGNLVVNSQKLERLSEGASH